MPFRIGDSLRCSIRDPVSRRFLKPTERFELGVFVAHEASREGGSPHSGPPLGMGLVSAEESAKYRGIHLEKLRTI